MPDASAEVKIVWSDEPDHGRNFEKSFLNRFCLQRLSVATVEAQIFEQITTVTDYRYRLGRNFFERFRL
jgi:hypothetical protein